MSQRKTRTGSLNSETTITLDDVKELISLSEERVISKLDSILTGIVALETRFDAIQTEQIRLGLEITSIKDVVIKQQIQIEKLEAERRQLNLVFSNVPETDIKVDDDKCLSDDIKKVEHLCDLISDDFLTQRDINTCYRIGPPKNGQKRLLLVKFNNLKSRNEMLFSQRAIRDDEHCRAAFGPVFINKDSTPLIRKEEKRLREKMKTLRSSSDPSDKIYIKSGKLYKNSCPIDQISIADQIF